MLPIVLFLKNYFFSYILSSFLVIFSGRASIRLVTLSIDVSFLFVAMYSLKKQVWLLGGIVVWILLTAFL